MPPDPDANKFPATRNLVQMLRSSPSMMASILIAAAVTLKVTVNARRRPTEALDAILVCGGGQTETGPPPHVLSRIAEAAAMYHAAPEDRKPMVIMLSKGTPHKHAPYDARGIEITEAAMSANVLTNNYSIPAEAILEEGLSLETIGNAFFARIIHTDPLGLRRLAIVTSAWHMPRVRAVFEHVYSLPSGAQTGTSPGYSLSYIETANDLPEDVLAIRSADESKKVSRYSAGSKWRLATLSMRELHSWMFHENMAYATARLTMARPEVDETLLKSYRNRS